MNRSAGAMMRAISTLFDLVLIISISQIVIGLVFIFNNIEKNFTIYLISTVSISFVFLFLQECLLRTSFGKYVIGLQIINSDGNDIIWYKYIFRSLFKIIWPIEYVKIAFSKNKLSISDGVFNTRVVNVDESKSAKLIRIVVAIIVIFIIGNINITINAVAYRNTDLFKALEREIESTNLTTPNIGGIKRMDYLPLQVRIENNTGLVVVKYMDLSDKKQIGYFTFNKMNTSWILKDAGSLEKTPGKVFSITYSNRKN